MGADLELRELVKKLLTYVSFHHIRGLDGVGFSIWTDSETEIQHFVCDDQQVLFERMRELVDSDD